MLAKDVCTQAAVSTCVSIHAARQVLSQQDSEAQATTPSEANSCDSPGTRS